ncbi:MAG: sulfatase-like hydrolase/transferase [Planctomycetota bacterium]
MANRKSRAKGLTPRRPKPPQPTLEKLSVRRRWLVGGMVIGVVGLGALLYSVVQLRVEPAAHAAIDLLPGAAAGFNVVLITLDTLRADRVGCYGYQGVSTPAIDRLAAEGIRFVDAVSVVPMTLPAHASILTGDYPPRHGVRDNGTFRLPAESETLAERLRAEGYATAAFIGAFVLDRRYGVAQGFDVYDDQIKLENGAPGPAHTNPQRPGNLVIDAALRWLAEHRERQPRQPFFAWLHLFDPHAPYEPPEPFKSRYASHPYDGEVAFTDLQVGRFVDQLRELDLLDRTLLIVLGDHGEGLGDHGESTHSLLIYECAIRVPLILYNPTLIPAGRVVEDRVVAIVDVLPTILDLLGRDLPHCDGVSLLQAPPDADRAVYVETLAPKFNHGWSPLYGLRRHHDKYIEAPTPEYYDLRADPAEKHNLWNERAGEADLLDERLAALVQSFPPAEEAGKAAAALDPEAVEKLAALGYLRGPTVTSSGPLPDPKDMVALLDQKLGQLTALVGTGRHAEAVPLLEELLARTPGDAGLWSLLSTAQVQAARLEEAIASRMRAIELLPNDPSFWVDLALLQHTKGDLQAAQISLAQAERLEPDFGGTYLLRAQFALSGKQYTEALTQCAQAAERDPTRYAAKAWSLQGKIYEELGMPAEAEAAYQRAHEANRFDPATLWGLAKTAEQQGRFDQAIVFAQGIPRGTPEWGPSRTTLAHAYIQLGLAEEAIRVVSEHVAAAPRDPIAHNNLGTVFLLLGRYPEAAASYRIALELDPGYSKARENLARALEAPKQTAPQSPSAP